MKNNICLLTTIEKLLYTLSQREWSFRQQVNNDQEFVEFRTIRRFLDENQDLVHQFPDIYFRRNEGAVDKYFMEFSELSESVLIYSGLNLSITKQFCFPPVRPHSLNCFEGVFIFAGSGFFHMDNQRFLLDEGDFLLHPPGKNYMFEMKDQSIGINITIRKKYLYERYPRLFRGVPEASVFFETALKNSKGENYLIFRNERDINYLRELLLHLFIEIVHEGANKAEISDNYLEIFIYQILNLSDNHVLSPHVISQHKRYYDLIHSYILENYRTVTLATVSQAVHLSPQYVCRILKEVGGHRFQEILTEKKLCKAKEYLMETSLSLETIAELVGYSSGPHLSNIFTKKEGITPSRFRKQTQ